LVVITCGDDRNFCRLNVVDLQKYILGQSHFQTRNFWQTSSSSEKKRFIHVFFYRNITT